MKAKEQVLKKLKNWFKTTQIISYDKDIGLQFWDKELRELRGEIKKEVYVISFKTEDKIERNKNGEIISLFEGMYCFAYFDAETLELLYIHKKAGYIEVDGSY